MSSVYPVDTVGKVVRASFDIGSSSTKMLCCEYSSESGVNTLTGQERPIPFGADYLKSPDGRIGEIIQLEGLAVLGELKAEAEKCGALQFSAIATEVFRKATNGNDYLNRVRAMGIDVTILTQELEARLGLESALITAGADIGEDDPCVWDSGGASFQISSRALSDEEEASFVIYLGSLGSAVCAAMLMRDIRQCSYSRDISPNPVSLTETSQLIELLMGELGPVPEWLKDKKEIIAVTGKNSIFKLCCNVLLELAKAGPTRPPGVFRADSLPDSPTVTSFSRDQAELALQTCVGCTDGELCKYVNFQYSDGPKVVVPKLCLLVAVMRHTGIQRVRTVKCIGSCLAVICNERFWHPQC